VAVSYSFLLAAGEDACQVVPSRPDDGIGGRGPLAFRHVAFEPHQEYPFG
jgi:hypothetical protein